MDARQLFLMSHADTHTTTLTPDVTTGREEGLCRGLAEAELRICPEGQFNSLAWLIWHMARCEDVMVNSILRDGSEVLDDRWLPRLGVTTRHIGTEDTMAEVEDFSQQVDVKVLRQYRAAVAQGTRSWAETVDFSSLDRILKCAGAERAAQRGALTERSDWVRGLWGAEKRTELWFLSWLAVGHNYIHIGEGSVTRNLIMQARQ